MPPDKSAHVAAPIAFQHRGETYLLSPLELVDLKELESYLRSLPIEEVKELAKDLPPAWVKVLLEKAYDRATDIRIGTQKFAEQSQTFEGLTYMLWLSLRKRRPQLHREAVVPILSSNLEELTGKINDAAGYSPDPTAPAADAATSTTTTTPSPTGPSTSSESTAS